MNGIANRNADAPSARGAFRCASCHSSKLKKLSLLYLQGTGAQNSFVFGFYRGLKGNFVASTSGTRQSLLAKRAAPPMKKSLAAFGALWLGMCLIFFIGEIIVLPASVDSTQLSVWAGFWLLIFVGGVVLRFRHVNEYNGRVWPRSYSRWERSYLCMQCGRVNVIQ